MSYQVTDYKSLVEKYGTDFTLQQISDSDLKDLVEYENELWVDSLGDLLLSDTDNDAPRSEWFEKVCAEYWRRNPQAKDEYQLLSTQ